MSGYKLRLVPIFLSFIVGISLTMLTYFVVIEWENEKARVTLEKQSGAYVKALKQSIFGLMNNMRSVEKLHEIQGELTKQNFHAFLNGGLTSQGGIKAMEWISKVEENDVILMEKEMRKTGIFDFSIREYSNPIDMSRGREVYYPILYADPIDQNGHNLGIDLGSSEIFNQAMQRAFTTGTVIASDPVPIVGNMDRRYQLRLFLPVFNVTRSDIDGFVSGLIHVDDLVEHVLGDPENSNKFHLSIVEVNDKGRVNEIYTSSWRKGASLKKQEEIEVFWTSEVLLAQKKWHLRFTAVESALDRSYAPLIIIIFGVLMTFALMWYLWKSHTHMKRVEQLIKKKTESLFDANRSLRKEIAERRRAEEQLFYSAYHDTLTSCLNRRAFNESLHTRFEEAKSKGSWNFGVLFVDLDRLKYVNDTFGHEAGDAVIIETSNRIQGQIRAGDRLARLGGDEFAVILEEIDELESAIEVANRVLKRLRIPFMLNGDEFNTSGSIGVALAHDLYEHPDDLLRDSDTAMYHAKNLGRNQHAVFNDEMHQRALRDIRLQTDLNQALKGDQFYLEYQPVFNVKTGEIKGFEALLRWAHPTDGNVGPNEFIEWAEELGLIHDIGARVIEMALQALSKFQMTENNAELCMNINVSPLQVLKPKLIETLKRELSTNQIEPHTCQIEVTERALGTSAEEMANYLKKLKDIGVKILVDDFGTEQASLNHLCIFPIDGLKIDRSFITDMENDLTKRNLVETMISLKDILDLDVTAEGVENQQHRDILEKLDCTFMQGFLMGKPMGFDAATVFLRHQ